MEWWYCDEAETQINQTIYENVSSIHDSSKNILKAQRHNQLRQSRQRREA